MNSSVHQIATQNSLELVEDPKAAAVEEIAAKLGLRKVRRHHKLKIWTLFIFPYPFLDPEFDSA